jgi:hypothetical protein
VVARVRVPIEVMRAAAGARDCREGAAFRWYAKRPDRGCRSVPLGRTRRAISPRACPGLDPEWRRTPRCRRAAGAAARPAPCDLVFPAKPHLVMKSPLYRRAGRERVGGLVQPGGEVFKCLDPGPGPARDGGPSTGSAGREAAERQAPEQPAKAGFATADAPAIEHRLQIDRISFRGRNPANRAGQLYGVQALAGSAGRQRCARIRSITRAASQPRAVRRGLRTGLWIANFPASTALVSGAK